MNLNILLLQLKYFHGDNNDDEITEMIVFPGKMLMINEKRC